MSQTFEFTIYCTKSTSCDHDEQLVDDLIDAGLNDALIGLGNPEFLGLCVDREGENFKEVVDSVTEQLKSVLPDTQILQVEFHEPTSDTTDDQVQTEGDNV